VVYVSIFLRRSNQVSVPLSANSSDTANCTSSIANAKVAGMMKDLHLSSGEYSLAIIIFFISYILFEIPSNLILCKTRPSLYLPTKMTLWGAVACCMAAVKNVQSLLALRFVLGLLEAGELHDYPQYTILLAHCCMKFSSRAGKNY
jgi:MFS family permease